MLQLYSVVLLKRSVSSATAVQCCVVAEVCAQHYRCTVLCCCRGLSPTLKMYSVALLQRSALKTTDIQYSLAAEVCTQNYMCILFPCCRSLRCHRTRIHKNLFVAISVQIAMRILLVVDQYIARTTGGEVAGASSGSSGALYDTVSKASHSMRDGRRGGGGGKGEKNRGEFKTGETGGGKRARGKEKEGHKT